MYLITFVDGNRIFKPAVEGTGYGHEGNMKRIFLELTVRKTFSYPQGTITFFFFWILIIMTLSSASR